MTGFYLETDPTILIMQFCFINVEVLPLYSFFYLSHFSQTEQPTFVSLPWYLFCFQVDGSEVIEVMQFMDELLPLLLGSFGTNTSVVSHKSRNMGMHFAYFFYLKCFS